MRVYVRSFTDYVTVITLIMSAIETGTMLSSSDINIGGSIISSSSTTCNISYRSITNNVITYCDIKLDY